MIIVLKDCPWRWLSQWWRMTWKKPTVHHRGLFLLL